MRVLFLFALCLASWSFDLHGQAPAVESKVNDHFALTFEYDADFPSLITATWLHSLSENDVLETSFYFDSFDLTLALIETWQHTFGGFTLIPGFVTTFGTASWNGSSDKKTYLFRDVGPVLSAVYANSFFHAETFNVFFFPTQEDPATALTLGISRFFIAGKWNEFGIGPRVELYFSKEGHGPMSVVECRVGGSVFKHWEKTAIDLFLGYNPVGAPSFLGHELKPAPVFRASFVHIF